MNKTRSESKKKSLDNLLVVWIFLIALSLRMIWLVQYQQSPTFDYPLLDFTFFQARANAYLNGQFFSEGYLFNPLYPMFLALVFKLFGHDLFFPRLIQVLLGSANVFMVFRLGKHAFDRYAALCAALLTAVYLPLIYFDAILMATSLITFLLLAGINGIVSAQRTGHIAWYILSGAGMGLVVLGRPNFLIVALVIALWIITLASHGTAWRRLGMGALFLGCIFLVISPITIHHWRTHKEFILVAPHGGINFYIGNNPDATGTYYSVPGISDNPGQQVRDSIDRVSEILGHPATASEASAYWMQQSIQFVKDDPGAFIRLFLRKLALYWNKSELPSEYSIDFDSRFHSVLRWPLPWFGFLGPLAITGIFFCVVFHRQKRRESVLLLAILGSMMFAVVLFFVHARYRMTSIPFICLFAGLAMAEFVRQLTAGNRRVLIPGLLILAAAAVFCNLRLFEPNPLPGYYNLASASYRAGDMPSAERWLTTILEQSESIKSRFLLGTIQQETGRTAMAEKNYRMILKQDPTHYDAALSLGVVLTQQGKIDQAEDIFRRGVEIDPDRPEARLNWAVLALKNDQLNVVSQQINILKTMPLNRKLQQQISQLEHLLKKQEAQDKGDSAPIMQIP